MFGGQSYTEASQLVPWGAFLHLLCCPVNSHLIHQRLPQGKEIQRHVMDTTKTSYQSGLWQQTPAGVHTLALPLEDCVTSGKLLTLSVPRFSHL